MTSLADYLRALGRQSFTAGGGAKRVMDLLPLLADVVRKSEKVCYGLDIGGLKSNQEISEGHVELRSALDRLSAAIADVEGGR